MLLSKLLVYFLCIALIAFIYVYKIPILCSECEKPTGFAADIFRCVLDEQHLCNVSHEINNIKDRAIEFTKWLGDIIITDLPAALREQLKKIYDFFEPIKTLIKSAMTKIYDAFTTIKTEIVDKISKIFTDLQKNFTTMFTEIGNGIKNYTMLIYQSIDNLRANIVTKITKVFDDVQTKIKEEIIDKINDNVIKPVKLAFEKMSTFFSSLIEKIISPFKTVFDSISGACVPELLIINATTIFNDINIDWAKISIPGLKIPKIAIPKFCPFSVIGTAWEALNTTITNAFNAILHPVTTAFAAVTKAFGELEATITNGINTVKTFINDKYTEIKTYITTAFEPIKQFFKDLGTTISTKLDEAYTFIKEKLEKIKDGITSFIKTTFRKLLNIIQTIINPIVNAFLLAFDAFKNIYKSFINLLKDLYKEVEKQVTIMYRFVADRIFYTLYIGYINFINTVLFALPISKTMKINLVNMVLLVGLMGVVVYYYNIIGNAVATALNGGLTIIGDTYGIVEATLLPILQTIGDITYSILGNLPTMTFAMDTLSFISPVTVIQNILQQLLDVSEVAIGTVKEVILTPYLIVVFVFVLVIAILMSIYKYMDSESVMTTLIEKILPLPTKPTMQELNTNNITKINNNIEKSAKIPIINNTLETKSSGAIDEFTAKMEIFKQRVKLIEEVRKEFEYNSATPNKELEVNLENMKRRLDERITEIEKLGYDAEDHLKKTKEAEQEKLKNYLTTQNELTAIAKAAAEKAAIAAIAKAAAEKAAIAAIEENNPFTLIERLAKKAAEEAAAAKKAIEEAAAKKAIEDAAAAKKAAEDAKKKAAEDIAAANSLDTYRINVGKDVVGNDIHYLLYYSSFSDCKKECDNRPDCKGFNFPLNQYPNGRGTCYIKNDVSNKIDNLDWNIFEKNSLGPANLEGYKATMGFDAGGNDITNLNNASFSECKTECNKRSDCKGFNFSSGSYPDKFGTCWIKNNVSNKAPSSTWNLFEKTIIDNQPIKSKLRDNFCLDVAGFGQDNGNIVQMWDCNGATNQKIKLDDKSRLVFNHSQKCLDVREAQTQNGADILQWDCGDGNNQKWTLDDNGQLRPRHAPWKCLDVEGYNTNAGARVSLYDCGDTVNQKWFI
jgi:hypothetical protein